MKLKPRSTIYDVARKANVSISTVSRYLNNPSQVNVQTAETIKSVIENLDYMPYGNTGQNHKRNLGRIGVLTPFFPAPSFVQRLQGITAALKQSACEMVIYAVDNPEQLSEYLHSIPFAKRLDGLIIMSMRISHEDSKRLVRSGLQTVVIEHHNPFFNCIEADNVLGGAIAARHFLEKGYAPCAFVGEAMIPPYSLKPSQDRLEGYKRALEEGGQDLDDAYVKLGTFDVEDARRLGGELLDMNPRPRAIFAMSDLQAIGIIKAVRDRGLEMPSDIAVLGFDDIDAADYVELSTVNQSLFESGRLATELLLARIKEPERPLQFIQLNVSIIQRKTT